MGKKGSSVGVGNVMTRVEEVERDGVVVEIVAGWWEVVVCWRL